MCRRVLLEVLLDARGLSPRLPPTATAAFGPRPRLKRHLQVGPVSLRVRSRAGPLGPDSTWNVFGGCPPKGGAIEVGPALVGQMPGLVRQTIQGWPGASFVVLGGHAICYCPAPKIHKGS